MSASDRFALLGLSYLIGMEAVRQRITVPPETALEVVRQIAGGAEVLRALSREDALQGARVGLTTAADDARRFGVPGDRDDQLEWATGYLLATCAIMEATAEAVALGKEAPVAEGIAEMAQDLREMLADRAIVPGVAAGAAACLASASAAPVEPSWTLPACDATARGAQEVAKALMRTLMEADLPSGYAMMLAFVASGLSAPVVVHGEVAADAGAVARAGHAVTYALTEAWQRPSLEVMVTSDVLAEGLRAWPQLIARHLSRWAFCAAPWRARVAASAAVHAVSLCVSRSMLPLNAVALGEWVRTGRGARVH